jgi:diguanylate cyclase (GGDEF)-like protein/PAS domain S-box-containing protein
MMPTLAFSLPGAMFGAALGSVVLVGAIFLLARGAAAPRGMSLFALAFLANAAHYGLVLMLPAEAATSFIADGAVHGAFSLLLLAGSLAMVGGRPPARIFVGAWVALVAYCVAAWHFIDDPALRYVPLYGLAGLALLVAGLVFLRQRRRHPGVGYGYAALLLIAWGLHKFDFPWVVGRPWLLAAGFALAEILATALAVAVIIIAERTQRRFADQARAQVEASAGRAEATAKYLEAILDRLADGVMTVDDQGRVQGFNPAAERIFGRRADQVVGRPASLVLPDSARPDRAGGLLDAFGDTAAAERTTHECDARRTDGARLMLEVSISHVMAGDQVVKVAVFRDVTGRRRGLAVDALIQELNQRVLQGQGMDSVAPWFCREILGLFNLNSAWISSKETDGTVIIQGVAGPPSVASFLRGLALRWDGAPDPRQPTSICLATGRPERLDGQDLPDALAGELTGILSLPLRAGAPVLGALTIGISARLDEGALGRLESLEARLGIALQVMNDQRRLRLQGAAMSSAANAIVITDRDGRIEWVNDAFTRLSGYDLAESAGKTLALLRSGAQTDEFYRQMWETIVAGQVWEGELIERRKDGSIYTVEQTVTPMRGSDERINHFVVVQEDITERKRAEERIRYLSSYDSLTGLPNRRLFRQQLAQVIARAEVVKEPAAVLFLDLDRFSRVNDTMGHDLGDRLLGQIVARLTSSTRAAETVARIGGDEFAAIMAERATGEAAVALAQRMLAAVTLPFVIDGQEIHMGASVGIALYPDDGTDADLLIKSADVAMYRAVREAPNGYCFYSTAMNEEMQARVNLERDLRRALARDEFELHYQPQLELLDGRVIGLEALLRWNHPTEGLIPPGRFIPLAEETGLIIPLGQLVVRQACRQVRAWLDAGLPMVPVAVNVSADQMRQPGLAEMIIGTIAEYGVDARWIELELTESAIMEDAGAAEQILRRLADAGIKLVIDDFGTGYSSLSYLKRFPVVKLKIDQSFISSLTAPDGNDAAIARAIITLGHSLGMSVVSEGVETDEQLAYLHAHGCDGVQGFLFSRPVPASQVPALLGPSRIRATG